MKLADKFRALLVKGLDQGAALQVLGQYPWPYRGDADPFVHMARERADNELEIDDDPLVSPADDGCWVAAWVWVSNDAAGVEEPDDDDVGL